MDFPDDLYYTDNHEWLRVDESNQTGTVGITDFAQSELGDVVFVEIEPEGTEVEQDGIFGTVEAVKTVSELYMPVAGTIVAINHDLESAPEKVNQDPYGEGWMVKVEISDVDALDALMDADEYKEMV